jgi:hypothetical protein
VNSAEPPRPGGSRAFKGSGYRLGDGEGQDSEEISGEPVAKSRRQVPVHLTKLGCFLTGNTC